MAENPFLVNVSTLIGTPGETIPQHFVGHIAGMATTESWVGDETPINVDVDLTSVIGGIVAKGTVSVEWSGECRRCLGDVVGFLSTPVKETFTAEEGEDTYPIGADEVDLEPMVRDAIVLALPLAPLCKEDCKGLCPNCGVNRNEESCDCQIDLTDPRWAALDDLKDLDE